jgi:hypothetical protein
MDRKTSSVMTLSMVLGAAALVGLAGRAAGGIVVIIEGKDNRNDVNNALHDIAGQAEANYLAKGYGVTRMSNQNGPLSKTDVINAINASGVNAVFFIGHGTVGSARVVLDYPSGGNNDKALRPQDLTGNYGGIKHVEIQACEQALDDWRTKFPGASLDAWSGDISVAQAANDVKFNAKNRIPRKNPPAPPVAPAPRPGPDPRLHQKMSESLGADGATEPLFSDWTGLGYQVPHSISALFGSQTFNIRSTDGVQYLALNGLGVSNGHVTQSVIGALPSPGFTLTFDSNAFETAMENVDTLGSLYAAGLVTVDNNVTGLPADVCFTAATAVYFGFGVNGCGTADFNCDGDIGTDSDIEAFFACLAGSCPFFPCANNADFNADGDVGTDQDIEAFFRVLGGGVC